MVERTAGLTEAAAPAFAQEGSYVDWPAILAGSVVASGVGFVFASFGAALGLTLVSPYEGDGSATAELVAIGSWMLWTTISSFMVGGYIAGRMRRRVDRASADEASVRDGVHGLAVWGAGILLGAFLLASTADTAAKATAEAAGAVAEATEEGAPDAAAEPPAMSRAEALAVAEAARRYSILSAFALAASLLIAGAGAYWAAGVGGQHRDEGRVFARFGRWS